MSQNLPRIELFLVFFCAHQLQNSISNRVGGSHFILFVGSKIHSFGVNDGKPKENQPIYFFPLLLFLDSESFVTSSDEIGERKKMSNCVRLDDVKVQIYFAFNFI